MQAPSHLQGILTCIANQISLPAKLSKSSHGNTVSALASASLIRHHPPETIREMPTGSTRLPHYQNPLSPMCTPSRPMIRTRVLSLQSSSLDCTSRPPFLPKFTKWWRTRRQRVGSRNSNVDRALAAYGKKLSTISVFVPFSAAMMQITSF